MCSKMWLILALRNICPSPRNVGQGVVGRKEGKKTKLSAKLPFNDAEPPGSFEVRAEKAILSWRRYFF